MSDEASLAAASALQLRARNAIAGHMPALDGLRAVAIAMVLAHNVGSEHPNTTALWYKALFYVHAPGWVGVQLFFALSGFLITGILLDTRDEPGAFRSFIARRALRIFPLYYAVLVVGLVIVPRFYHGHHFVESLRYQAWYWSYLSNWVAPFGREITPLAHCWSLAVEEQFYLFWPLLALFLSPRALLRVSFGLAVVALGVRIGVHVLHASPLIAYQWTIARVDALVIGAAAAVVIRDRALLERIAPTLRRNFYVMLGALALLWPFSHGFNRDHVLTQTVGYTLLAIACTQLVLLVVLEKDSRLARALSGKTLRFVGKYSYGIYVLHVPIYQLMARPLRPLIADPSPVRSVLALLLLEVAVAAASVLAAVVTWHLLEKHFLALKDVLAPRRARVVTHGNTPLPSR